MKLQSRQSEHQTSNAKKDSHRICLSGGEGKGRGMEGSMGRGREKERRRREEEEAVRREKEVVRGMRQRLFLNLASGSTQQGVCFRNPWALEELPCYVHVVVLYIGCSMLNGHAPYCILRRGSTVQAHTPYFSMPFILCEAM